MAQAHYKALLGKVLLGFITEKDPVPSMLEWVAHQMMLIEAEGKVGAEKGKHSKHRKTYFSGARVRQMDTRLGTIYLYVPKLRKGGYVPFFVTERKRSELALAALVQEAFINGVSTRRKIYKFTIGSMYTSYLFKAGHEITVWISSSYFPHFDRNLNTGHPFGEDEEMVPANQTIYQDKKFPSRVILPIIPK